MKTTLIFSSLFLCATAFSAEQVLNLSQRDLNAKATTKEVAVDSEVTVNVDASSVDSTLNVEVIHEGLEASCWYVAPVQKVISQSWSHFAVKLAWNPGNDDRTCTFRLTESTGKSVDVKLKD